MKKIAEYLLQINAINFNLQILLRGQVDGNLLFIAIIIENLSYLLSESTCTVVCSKRKEMYPHTGNCRGGNGAIAIGFLLPKKIFRLFMCVHRQSTRTPNTIEGYFEKDKNVVVIEFNFYWRSSLKAVEALRDAGCNVLGMCNFTYEFEIAMQNF